MAINKQLNSELKVLKLQTGGVWGCLRTIYCILNGCFCGGVRKIIISPTGCTSALNAHVVVFHGEREKKYYYKLWRRARGPQFIE